MEVGILINQIKYLQKMYLSTVVQTVTDDGQNSQQLCDFLPKKSFFVVESPHIVKKIEFQEANKHSNQITKAGLNKNLDFSSAKVRKKRKRKLPLNQGELDMIKYHEKIKNHLCNAALNVSQHFPIDFKRQDSFFDAGNPTTKHATHNSHCMVLKNLNFFSEGKVCCDGDRLFENSCSFAHFVKTSSNSYLIPKHCKFVCSDITNLNALTNDCKENGKYSCVVLDPPWENKSVKRSKRYDTLSFDEIASLPMQELCKDGCMIIIWVTNKQKIMKWVKETLFKKWGVTFITEWHWVKLTTAGEPVFPWDSLHKKPYETMLLGCYKNNAYLTKCEVVQNLVLCSVPSSIHSHKPPLCEIIKSRVQPLFKESFKCLEMFARNLNSDWTSWGNEVLMMQNIMYFDQVGSIFCM